MNGGQLGFYILLGFKQKKSMVYLKHASAPTWFVLREVMIPFWVGKTGTSEEE